ALLLGQQTVHLRDPRIRLTGAVEHEILLRIVGARDPGRAAVARLHRQAVPGVEVGIARLRDGVHTPFLGTGLGIVTGDEAATGLRIAAAGHALHDRAVGHEWAAGVAPALAPVGGRVIPSDLAGLHVERDQVRV